MEPHRTFQSPWVMNHQLVELCELLESMEAEEWLSHRTLCAIRMFAAMDESKDAYLKSYLASSPKFQNEISYSFRIPYFNAHNGGRRTPPPTFLNTGNPEDSQDMITDIIRDDCACCFKFLEAIVPGLTPLSYNVHGWNFLSMATVHGSLNVFKHFVQRDRTIALHMISKSFAGQTDCWPMPLSFLHPDTNISFPFLSLWVEQLTDLRMVGKKCITAAIHPIDKIHFCQFFHLGMATLMESIGASIENAQISESDKSLSPFSVGTTSWHGATANSADFMNRMAERSALSFTWSNQAGDCPIHWAVRYQNLETALWLYDHGAIPRFSIPMEETETIWHQALHETGEKSPMIFEMLMPSCNNQMDQVDRYAVASLFHQIMLTTMDCVMCAAVTTIDNLEFEMLREQLKAEGIQKCKLIWEDFVDVDLSPERADAAAKLHNKAVSVMRYLELGSLADAMMCAPVEEEQDLDEDFADG